MPQSWEIYEHAARTVLADIRRTLGIASVEGKQSLVGASGTSWEVDARAWREGADDFLVVEIRKHTSAGLKQEQLAAIAYRVGDVGGAGGIVVSPLPLQKGAAIVAASAGIGHIRLAPDSTTENYLAEYMGQRYLGAAVTEVVRITDTCDAVVIRAKPNGA